MKKYIFMLLAMLTFASMAYGVASNRVYYHVDVVDEFGDTITSPAITQVDVQNESGTAVAVYSTKFGSTEVGSTGVITTGLADGRTEFWYADTAIDLTVTDGTRTYEIESYSVRTARFMLPSFLISTSGNALGQTDDMDFTHASWIIDGDTANRLDIISDNDSAILAIGDTDTQADVYIYSNTTSDYWLFDEGAGEVYHENIDLQFGDGDFLYLGADNDVSVTFDGTNFEIFAITQNVPLAIGDATNGFDFTYSFETAGSFRSDYNADFINLTDDMGLRFGAGASSNGDIKISSNSSNVLQIEQVVLDTGTIEIGVDNRDIPIKWYGESASSYFNLTGDDVNIEAMNLAFGDADKILLGDTLGVGDAQIYSTSAVLYIGQVSADTGTIVIGASDHDMPLKWWGETSTSYFNLTGDDVNIEGMNLALGDGDAILLGDALGAGDFTLSSTSAVLTLAQVVADTGTVVIGADNTDIPITWHGETAGSDVILTGDTILIDGVDMTFEDADVLKFGDAGADGTIQSDGTNIDVDINAAMTLGDGGATNYAQIAADGEITLTGTACVTKNHQLPIATGGGTVTVSALTGAPSIDFNADGEIVYASFQVPNDWNATSDMTIVAMVKNEIAETDGDDIEIVCTVKGIADGEAHTDAGQTVTMALDLTGGDQAQNVVNKCTGTIDYNEGSHPIAAGDTVIIKGVISLGAGTECTGPLHIIDWWVEYTANKLGTAT